MTREMYLIKTAEQHPDDKTSAEAMKQLREEFDPTYGWCADCDGLVVKESECCMNQAMDKTVEILTKFNEDKPYE